jgi:lambda family phage portal protein
VAIINKLFPGWAENRARAETALISAETDKKKAELMQEAVKTYANYTHEGASHRKNAFAGVDDSIYTHDEDITDNIQTLIARSRRNYYGNAIARGALSKLTNSVVHTGLKLKVSPNNKILKLTEVELDAFQDEIQATWNLWAGSTECDVTRQSNFYQIQSLAFLTMLMDGTCFIKIKYKKRKGEYFETKLKFLDAGRLYSPEGDTFDGKIRNGVEYNEDGEPVAYHFRKSDTDIETKRIATFTPSGARQLIVLMAKERPNQRLGVPFLSPVLEILTQLTKYTNAELMATVINSLFTVFIETEKGAEQPISIEGIPQMAKPGPHGEEEINMRIGSGSILNLEPGQKISLADPKRPSQNFEPYFMAICKLIGSSLDIPHEILMSKFDASYSASRGAVLEFFKHVLALRADLIQNLCVPVYQLHFEEAVAKKYITIRHDIANPIYRAAYTDGEWYGTAMSQLDPKKEVEAALIRINNGLSTRAREARSLNGSDVEENFRQLEKEKKQIKKTREVKKEDVKTPNEADGKAT